MKRAPILGLVLLLCSFFSSHALAQSVTGSIVGAVTDQTGGILPGVAVRLTRSETGFQRETLTNDRGDYQFVLIPVGVYTLEAEFPGFKTEVRSGITVQTDVRSRVDIKLSIGEVSEKISVTEDAPLLRSETSEVGTVINNRTVQDLPLNGRQFQSLAFTSPGIALPAPGSTIAFRGSIVVVGKRESDNLFILDGIDITQQNVRQPILSPTIDSLQEFKVQTWNYTAEFGRQTGGQLLMTTKSGTNRFSGDIFEFARNEVLDARNYFDSPSGPKPPLKRHNFGGVLGGPIVKDRTFFFGSYEGLREHRSFTRVATVPLPEFWNGDFSTLLRQPKPIQLIDPLSRQPFPGNIIPTNRLNFASLVTRQVYPAANLGVPGALSQNYVASATRVTATDSLSGRVDHRFNEHHSIFARHSYEYTEIVDPYDDFAGLSNLPAFPRFDRQRNQALSINETWAISPTMVNEFRTGLGRFVQFRDNTNHFYFNGAAGFKNFDTDPINYSYPAMTIPGYTIGKSNEPLGLSNNRYQLVDSISINRGSHGFKFGTDTVRDQIYKWNNSNIRGSYNFSGGLSGYSFSDFVLGLPISGTRAVGDSHTWMSWWSIAAYAQDDWKLTSRLTLNLGVRYDLYTPIVDKVSQRWARFNAETRKVEIAGTSQNPRRDSARPERFYPAIAAASARVPQVDLGYDEIWNKTWSLSPRLGFAYRIKDATVLRGGYGIFTQMNQTGSGGPQGVGNNFPFLTTQTVNTNQSAPNFFFRDDPFVNAQQGDISLSSVDPKMRTPYVQNWNLGIERELMADLLVDVSYIGSSSTHLLMSRNINEPYRDGDSRPIAQRRPIPGWGNISQTEDSASANFHSMQAKLEKRMSLGVQLTSSLMWGHSIDNHSGIDGVGSTNGLQSAWDIRNQRGRSTFDVRKRVTLNGIFELPVGHGRQFLAGLNGVGEAVLGGWQVGTIMTMQSGNPLTITVGGTNSNVGGTDRADMVAGQNPVLDHPSPERFFNTAAFAKPAQYRWGNSGRDIIDGPGVQQLDMNLDKNFRFGETQRIQFRAEFFNILNHPNFFPPDTNVASPTFGKISQTGNFTSRQIQFGLKFYF